MFPTRLAVVLIAALLLSGPSGAQVPPICDIDTGFGSCPDDCGWACYGAAGFCENAEDQVGNDFYTCWLLLEECLEACEQDCVADECPEYPGTPWFIDKMNTTLPYDLGNGTEERVAAGTPSAPFLTIREAQAELVNDLATDGTPDNPDQLHVWLIAPGVYQETDPGSLIINQPRWLVNNGHGVVVIR